MSQPENEYRDALDKLPKRTEHGHVWVPLQQVEALLAGELGMCKTHVTPHPQNAHCQNWRAALASREPAMSDTKGQPVESTASAFEEWWDENGIDYVPAGELGRPTAKELAQAGWQARGASEYERGRRDMEKLRDEWARRAKEFMALATKGDALWERSLTYTTVIEEVDALLAATSGTPAEHDPARAPHNKFASFWCDACPRPTSGTPAALYPGPKCSHGVLMREFCQGCEDAGQAAAPGGKEPAPDWCDVCNASQMVVEDGEHVCGLTTYEAYSLGWRRGNNASHPLQDKPPAAPLCGKRIPETGLGCTLEPGHQGRHDVDVTKVK